jgi:hypothetical protein
VAGSWSCRAALSRRQHLVWPLWLQVRELAGVRRELGERGVRILREPKQEPWGLLEMWIADPDGVRICIVEVPAEHPQRWRG